MAWLFTVAAALLRGTPSHAQPVRLPLCKLLNDLSPFRDQVVAVSGEVVGSFRHGFFLAPEGRAETCPGWPEHGFKKRALIALTFPLDRSGRALVIPPEFVRFQKTLQRHVYPRVITTLVGRISANRFVLSFRRGSGEWAGLIGGEPYPDGSVPARLEVQRVTDWTATVDEPNNGATIGRGDTRRSPCVAYIWPGPFCLSLLLAVLSNRRRVPSLFAIRSVSKWKQPSASS